MVRAANERSNTFYAGCILWISLAVLLTIYDFGVIAFCGSVILGIYFFGLKEKFSNEETASAYSVFNKNNQAIAGSYTAQHLENQLRGREQQGRDYLLMGSVAKADVNTVSSSGKSNDGQAQLRRRQSAAAAAEKRLSFQNS
mmetsp:Transcript_37779/g.43154  ORF Transcript_37779/g.43154 Transcript_37779/m.43154 type:complete len:142 (-) Transcript_37779:225-650(-)